MAYSEEPSMINEENILIRKKLNFLFNLCHETHEKKTSKILHNWGLENVFWIDPNHSTDQLTVVITKYWWHIPVEV